MESSAPGRYLGTFSTKGCGLFIPAGLKLGAIYFNQFGSKTV